MKNTAVAKKEDVKKNETVALRDEHPFFNSLQQEMNRLFEEFRGTLGLTSGHWFHPLADFRATLDLKDSDKELIVNAELPGVDMKDIDVSVTDNALCIKGEKREEKEDKDKGYYRMERSYGSFHRLIPLPCGVDKDNITALYKDGILKITLPKTKESLNNEKKIVVKGA